MSKNSLVTRSGYQYKFDKDNIDTFYNEFTSLITPVEAKAKQFILAIQGGYDNHSLFLNDLHIYINYFETISGSRRSVDVTAAISRHYISVLLDQFPTVDQFVGNTPFPRSRLIDKFITLVGFFEPDVTESQREKRAREVLMGIYDRIPTDGAGDMLGKGNRISELDAIHWFSLIHSEIPVVPVDLATLTEADGTTSLLPDLEKLTEPVSITFSSGPLAMSRINRNSSSQFTRGMFYFDFSIVYENPISDDIANILDQIEINKNEIARLDRKTKTIIKKIYSMDSNLAENLKNYNTVKNATKGIELQLTEIKSDLVENTSILNGINDQISNL